MFPTFFVTFGQKYLTEPHPSGRHAHPHGYVAVVAENRDQAMFVANLIFDKEWSNVYEEWEFNPARYPLGELSRHVAGQESEPDEQTLITEDGRLLVLGLPRVFTPGEAFAFANRIGDAATEAVRRTREQAAERTRLAEVGVKKHDDMF